MPFKICILQNIRDSNAAGGKLGNCLRWSPLILSVETLVKAGARSCPCWLSISRRKAWERRASQTLTHHLNLAPWDPKANELLRVPRVLIWHMFVRWELQRASPLLWVKPAHGPGWFCWLCVCQWRLITVIKCGSAERLVKYFPIAPATSPV